MMKWWVIGVLGLAVLGVVIWTSDRITLQGERTIYSVTCEGGMWSGLTCSGRLVAGDLYRFRSSRARGEVLFWIAGSGKPSGKYSDCQVKDRDNWSCNALTGQPPSIAHEFSGGRPTSFVEGLDVPFHAVAKWKWWALRSGIPAFTEADYSNGSTARPPVK